MICQKLIFCSTLESYFSVCRVPNCVILFSNKLQNILHCLSKFQFNTLNNLGDMPFEIWDVAALFIGKTIGSRSICWSLTDRLLISCLSSPPPAKVYSIAVDLLIDLPINLYKFLQTLKYHNFLKRTPIFKCFKALDIHYFTYRKFHNQTPFRLRDISFKNENLV